MRPGREPGEEPLEGGERLPERSPVLQVQGAAHVLTGGREALPPRPAAHALVPGLQGVDAAREQQRQ